MPTTGRRRRSGSRPSSRCSAASTPRSWRSGSGSTAPSSIARRSSRAIERQSAALVTSRLNGTDHCASGLRLKLESLGLAAEVLDAIDADPAHVQSGDGRFDAICAHAAKLAQSPAAVTRDDLGPLREHGLSDLDILDLNNMVAYYAYINRVVMGLGAPQRDDLHPRGDERGPRRLPHDHRRRCPSIRGRGPRTPA